MDNFSFFNSLFSIILFILLITLIYELIIYIIYSFTHMKALKLVGYSNPWYAWIPFINYYAFTDAVCEDEYIYILQIKVPTEYFKFWWVLQILLPITPLAGIILSMLLKTICLGTIYTKFYAKIEQQPEENVQVLGYISGFLRIVPIVKFFIYKNNIKKIDIM